MAKVHGFAEVTESEPQKLGQGYGLIRAYRFEPCARLNRMDPEFNRKSVPYPSSLNDVALQVNIRRDAYCEQSHYRVSILTPGGWQLLHSLIPSEVEEMMPSYVAWNRKKDECVKSIELVAQHLIMEAERILAVP